MTHRVLTSAAITTALAFSTGAQAITVGSYKGNLGDYLECDKNSITQALCEVAQNEINQVLERYDYPITISRNLFTYDQSMSEQLTGSCSRKTYLTRAYGRIDIEEGTGIRLSGNLLDRPVVFAATLNTRNYVRFDLKDNFGKRTPFGCSKYGDDRYYIDATSYLNTELVSYFSLEPRWKHTPEGDFVIEIKPIFDLRSNVSFDLKDFDIHGASSLGSAFANLTSRVHYMDNLAYTVMNGGNSDEIIMAAIDPMVQTAYGTVLDNFSFGDPLELEHRVKSWAQDYSNDTASEIAARTFDVTRDVNSKIKTALALDSTGRAFLAFNSRLERIPVTELHKSYLNCGNGQVYNLGSGSHTNTCGKYSIGFSSSSSGPISKREGTLYETFTDVNGKTTSTTYQGSKTLYNFSKTQPGTYRYSGRLCLEYLSDPSTRTCSATSSTTVTVTAVD